MVRKNQKYAIAFCMVVLSSVLFGASPLLMKEALVSGVDVSSSIVYRQIVISAFGFLMAICTGNSLHVTKKQLMHLAFFGIVGYGLTNLLLSSSYLYIDMSVATMCHFTFPVMVTLVMVALFKEKCPMTKRIAVVCTLIGVILLISVNGVADMTGVLLAVGSGATYGVYVISQEKSSLRELNAFVVVAYVGLACGIFFLASMYARGGNARGVDHQTGGVPRW